MKFLRAFHVQLRQMLSWQLALCGVLTAMVMELSVSGVIAEREDFTNVWYLVRLNGAGHLTLFVLPALPFAMSLSRDWGSHAAPYWVVREGIANYTISKLLASALAGFLTVGLGLTLFVLVNCTYLPWFRSCSDMDYEQLFEAGHIFMGWLCYILHMALSGALIGTLGMFMSILVPNQFVAISAPLAIHLTVMRIMPTRLISPASIWHPTNWVQGVHHSSLPGLTLLGKLLFTAGFCAAMCAAGCICMKRRMERG